MDPFPQYDDIKEIIELAKREDLRGAGRERDDDVTSRLTIAADQIARATLVQKEPGVVCGLPIVAMICKAYDERLRVEPLEGKSIDAIEGTFSEAKKRPLLVISGPLRSLLSAERIVLNFLQHLSGVATRTHQFVEAVKGTRAKIYDTRKTLPGLRLLDKYAVRCGGGMNHRMGLYDGLLVKDNHLAAIPLAKLAEELGKTVGQSRSEVRDRFIEIEVDSLDQLREVLKIPKVDAILLDNMDCATMKRAVGMRDQAGLQGKTELEASGGINMQTVRAIAETGVERISIGAITHSAPALDIGLDIE